MRLRPTFPVLLKTCVGFIVVLLIPPTILGSTAHALTPTCQVPASSINFPTQSDQPASESTQDLSKPQVRDLKGGEVHTYQVVLEAGQYWQAVVEQQGIDVLVTVFDPKDRQVYFLDSPNGRSGPERIFLVAVTSGLHRLEVRPAEPAAEPGQYTIQAEPVRKATSLDQARMDGELAFGQGMQFYQQSTKESFEQALVQYDLARRAFQTSGDKLLEAQTLTFKVLAMDTLGDKEQALKLAYELLALWKAVDNRVEEVRTLNYIGLACNTQGNHLKALETLNQAADRLKGIHDPSVEALTRTNLGVVYGDLGESRKALAAFTTAQPVWRELHDKFNENTGLLNIGQCLYQLGETPKAIESIEAALQLAHEINDPLGESQAAQALSGIFRALGQYPKALSFAQQTLKLRQVAGDRFGETSALNELGLTYYSLGQYQKSLELHQQALTLARETKAYLTETRILVNLGVAYTTLKDYKKGLQALQQALVLLKKGDDRFTEAAALENLGAIYSDTGNYRKSLEYYHRCHKLDLAVGLPRNIGYSLYRLGIGYHNLDNWPKALQYLTSALETFQKVQDPRCEASAYFALARTLSAQGRYQEALERVEKAIEVAEAIRQNVQGDEFRSSFFATVQDYFELKIELLMRLHKKSPEAGHHLAALQSNEQARARSLLELLTESQANIREGIAPELLAKEQEVKVRLTSKLERLTQLLSGNAPSEEQATLQKEIDGLKTEYREVQNQIRTQSPHYAALTQPQPLTAQEIQTQVVDSETALLEYALCETTSYLWVVTPTGVKSFSLPPRDVIEKKARQVREFLLERTNTKPVSTSTQGSKSKASRNLQKGSDQRKVRVSQADQQFFQAAAQLSQMILGPAAQDLTNKRLVIVPDGALQYIPFSALCLPSPTLNQTKPGTRYTEPLIVRHEIVTLPSASTLAVLRHETASRQPAPNQLVILADPVFGGDDDDRVSSMKSASSLQPSPTGLQPESTSGLASEYVATRLLGRSEDTASSDSRSSLQIPRLFFTRDEANQILNLAGETTTLKALDFSVNRALISEGRLSSYRYIHFATHGWLDAEHPEFSALLLSMVNEKGEPQDGFLRALEIFNLNLPAEMVVLSACQTGLGKEIKGEGVVGLTRGFMYAGAKRVVVSLWSVSDKATADLMTRFYQKIFREGMPPAAALRAAQLELWQSEKWRAPFFWAPFVIQGEWK
ncbi:MAG: CHAT domain-containing protein [Acidobacteria bacterium]|nr:CHAT domain-containing protein [Acidobacteriota bacterium]